MLLSGGKVEVNQTAGGISLQIPAEGRTGAQAVVKLDLDGSAMDIPAMPAN